MLCTAHEDQAATMPQLRFLEYVNTGHGRVRKPRGSGGGPAKNVAPALIPDLVPDLIPGGPAANFSTQKFPGLRDWDFTCTNFRAVLGCMC